MDFETVYGIPEGALKTGFLTEEERGVLQPLVLLYFLRGINYNVLDDFPCQGDSVRRLKFSEINGPSRTPEGAVPRSDTRYDDVQEISKLVSIDSHIPQFERISLRTYGTNTDYSSIESIMGITDKFVNSQQIWNIGEGVLKRMQSLEKFEEYERDCYRAKVDGCILEFKLEKGCYSLVHMSVLGKGDAPDRIISDFGLPELKNQFRRLDVHVGISNTTQNGLAYDLNLNGESIEDTIKAENVIL
jgi:hypothetical protein